MIDHSSNTPAISCPTTWALALNRPHCGYERLSLTCCKCQGASLLGPASGPRAASSFFPFLAPFSPHVSISHPPSDATLTTLCGFFCLIKVACFFYHVLREDTNVLGLGVHNVIIYLVWKSLVTNVIILHTPATTPASRTRITEGFSSSM